MLKEDSQKAIKRITVRELPYLRANRLPELQLKKVSRNI